MFNLLKYLLGNWIKGSKTEPKPKALCPQKVGYIRMLVEKYIQQTDQNKEQVWRDCKNAMNKRMAQLRKEREEQLKNIFDPICDEINERNRIRVAAAANNNKRFPFSTYKIFKIIPNQFNWH